MPATERAFPFLSQTSSLNADPSPLVPGASSIVPIALCSKRAYIYDMRLFFFALILLWYTGAFAAGCGSTVSNPTVGMQRVTEGSSITPSLTNTINISGIVVEPNVDYDFSPACIISAMPHCKITIRTNDSSSNNGLTSGKKGQVAALKNFQMSFDNESPMSKVADSSWIIYPSDLNLQVGDSLYIKDYSAVYAFLFNERTHCDGPAEMYATGEYFVTPTDETLSASNVRVLIVEKPKIHNRDAGGRCVNDKKRNVIKY